MKIGLGLLFCLCAMAQGFGRIEAMRPWLKGHFQEAEQIFRARHAGPLFAEGYLWEAEFEIERARFGPASTLIDEARKIVTSDSAGLPERRLARLYLTMGRFAEAEKLALEDRRWDGKDTVRLKLVAPMDMVTLGEITLARGDAATAVAMLEKARDKARSTSTVDGLEWVKAQDDLALGYIALGSMQSASQAARAALTAAAHEWGNSSIPAADSLDTLGLVQIAEQDCKSAGESLTRSRSWRESIYPHDHPKIAASYLHAALLHATEGQTSDALRFVHAGLEIEKDLTVGPNGRWALALLAAAGIYAQAGQKFDAVSHESAIPVLEYELGVDSPRMVSARKQSADLMRK